MIKEYLRSSVCLCYLLSASASGALVADEVSDLKALLASFSGTSDVSVAVVFHKTTEGEVEDQAQIRHGHANFGIAHQQGRVSVSYDDNLLVALQNEKQGKQDDDDFKTPTLEALRSWQLSDLPDFLNAAPKVSAWIEQGEFKDVISLDDGKLLQFSMPLKSMLDANMRKYVDKFTCDLWININNEGVPRSASMKMEGSGSAFIFFSVKATNSLDITFDVVGDRIVQTSNVQEWYHRSTFSEGKTQQTVRLSIPE